MSGWRRITPVPEQGASTRMASNFYLAIDMPGADTVLPELQGDATPHLQIIPLGMGFRVDLFVRPFGDKGPYLKPGAGAANLIVEIDGKRLKAKRDLKTELERTREMNAVDRKSVV